MSSIPADPTLILGNLIDPQKIKQLGLIANAQAPSEDARERLSRLILSGYKLDMVYKQMVNMKASEKTLKELNAEKNEFKKQISEAAIKYAKATVKSQRKVMKLKEKGPQTMISINPESPVNFKKSKVTNRELGMDSMKMDVQFFRQETVSSEEHAQTVSSFVQNSFQDWGTDSKTTKEMTKDSHSATKTQASNHNLEGTIVIITNCTHKEATIIDPCVIDAKKAIAAWNFTFPSNTIPPDNEGTIKQIATKKQQQNSKTVLHILSACTRGSSFVGFVHILKVDSSKEESGEKAKKEAKEMKKEIEREMYTSSLSGKFGGEDLAKRLSKLSKLSNHCSLVCQGVIPNIACNTLSTTIKSLKPKPRDILNQINALKMNSNPMNNSKSMKAMAVTARKGAQFMAVSKEYTKTTVSAIMKSQNEKNKIIDIESLMTAFGDYLEAASRGKSGVPINFYIKTLTQQEIAKCYMNEKNPQKKKGEAEGGGEVEPEEELPEEE
mmetsp:Transcript_27889/g.31887  ORF Transcript_27889/g.31887 Transcript_27889/m.31887 type:complete len:496 (+) Transcript_27889:152-1639(+)|eukprot:CAMPEP_0194185740 /NCGR_PEP_ID=MMETSP0154-20130528/44012_1 /TAXON_ID=1049557 /ORGANISM="Thalassiothrix antarctica, Strain L6-D1" /LENGTH=495 /DNA_ID=CAMNT_0038904303 /DNA_START=56 /DNA_END=1543 /DNA_ORIENTATION=-